MSSPITVYMLHLEYPSGQCAHYVGSTRTDRLLLRLAEHRAGHGADTTSIAVRKGATIKLGATIGVPDRASEVFFAAADAPELMCSICGIIRRS